MTAENKNSFGYDTRNKTFEHYLNFECYDREVCMYRCLEDQRCLFATYLGDVYQGHECSLYDIGRPDQQRMSIDVWLEDDYDPIYYCDPSMLSNSS